MTSSKRRKAAFAAAKRQWNAGELVLAKLKGFPAWPARVTESDSHGFRSDKKVHVLFFGTFQIGICSPADVEEFTEEKKQSLLQRLGKSNDFSKAVKEIIDLHEQEETRARREPAGFRSGKNGIAKEDPQIEECSALSCSESVRQDEKSFNDGEKSAGDGYSDDVRGGKGLTSSPDFPDSSAFLSCGSTGDPVSHILTADSDADASFDGGTEGGRALESGKTRRREEALKRQRVISGLSDEEFDGGCGHVDGDEHLPFIKRARMRINTSDDCEALLPPSKRLIRAFQAMSTSARRSCCTISQSKGSDESFESEAGSSNGKGRSNADLFL